jgi:hypothetical protein
MKAGILSLHWQGKFRGAEFEPLSMELQRYETSLICDNQGRVMPTILAKPILMARAAQLAKENLKLEDKLLISIRDFPAISLEQRGTDCGRREQAEGRARPSEDGRAEACPQVPHQLGTHQRRRARP